MSASKTYSNSDFLRFLICAPFFYMLGLLVLEAGLAATTTWLIIQAGQDLANEDFLIADFGRIVLTQSAAYVIGAISWIFAEQAGFGAFGRYMLRFAKDNKREPRVLANKDAREQVEPFLTNEAFHIFFELVYELEADLKLFFNLLFNTLVLGVAIDAGLPIVYGGVFIVLLGIQIGLRKWISKRYSDNQRATNRMTAHTYTAWDNIFTGNRYNFRLWHGGFKQRLRTALRAQINAIMAREGIAAIGGILALVAVFAYLAFVAGKNTNNAGLLIALAATLPRQIDLSHDLHGLATGWNDLLAVWTRITGACNAMNPAPDAAFESRIQFARLKLVHSPSQGTAYDQPGTLTRPAHTLACQTLDDLLHQVQQLQSGTVRVRGGNGSGKSTLLATIKARLGAKAYYWPTGDQLCFAFNQASLAAQHEKSLEDDNAESSEQESPQVGAVAHASPATQPPAKPAKTAFSSGEQQINSLREIVANTHASVYLLDEWDANLDAKNAIQAQQLVDQLAQRAMVLEISHRV